MKLRLLVGAALGAAAFVEARTRAAERAHRVRGRFVDVDGVRLHYLERGEGRALVFLHGIGSMIDDFVLSGLVARAAEHCRVIVIDRRATAKVPGRARGSGRPPRRPISSTARCAGSTCIAR